MSPENNSSTAILDCCKVDCPEPVLRCRNLIKDNEELNSLLVIVDNQAAKENVSRYLGSASFVWEAKADPSGDRWLIRAERQIKPFTPSGQDNKAHNDPAQFASSQHHAAQKHEDPNIYSSHAQKKRCVAFITSEFVGSGDDSLGAKLMLNLLGTLPELGDELWKVILLNSAVRLSASEHPACQKLKTLEEKGVEVLVCGTCLEHFSLSDKRGVGSTTNMLDVVSALHLADKIIRP